jgi:hypothetical protein
MWSGGGPGKRPAPRVLCAATRIAALFLAARFLTSQKFLNLFGKRWKVSRECLFCHPERVCESRDPGSFYAEILAMLVGKIGVLRLAQRSLRTTERSFFCDHPERRLPK